MYKSQSRRRFSVEFKLQVVNEYNALPVFGGLRQGVTALANKHGLAHQVIARWHHEFLLEREKSKPPVVETYRLAGVDFKTKADAIRYAVELAGGLVVLQEVKQIIAKKVSV